MPWLPSKEMCLTIILTEGWTLIKAMRKPSCTITVVFCETSRISIEMSKKKLPRF